MSFGNIHYASNLLTSTFNRLLTNSFLLNDEDKLNSIIIDNIKSFITSDLNSKTTNSIADAKTLMTLMPVCVKKIEGSRDGR